MSGDAKQELVACADGMRRCWWCAGNPLYERYHDEEWGDPVADDHRLFEKLCLEGFQAGLSWLMILRKRDRFRVAFRGFDPEIVATFGARDVARLMQDEGIVRHRGKIEAAITNAKRTVEIVGEHGSLAAFVWGFEPPLSERPQRVDRAAIERLVRTPSSIALSAALRKRGFKFVGPTTAYAFMQAMGLVNDHVEGCATRERAEERRGRFVRPRSSAGT